VHERAFAWLSVLLLVACGGTGDRAADTASGGAGHGGMSASAGAGGRGKSGAGGGGGAQGTAGAGARAAAGTAGAGSPPSGVTYTTTFDRAESPLLEQGAWHHDGLDWTTVETAGGIAYGTQLIGVARSGPTGYDDSYAYLAGFPADQQASAVVSLGSIDASCTHEVEVLLRWDDSAHVARGYECNVAFDGAYAQIVRWNGPVGDYTYLGSGSVSGGVHDGDIVSAAIVAGHITLSVNGTERATADDATFATGNPGIGFWRGDSGCGAFGDYGFTSFTASARSN
jgi:hypothetical protein